MIKPSCSKARRLVLESEGGRIESADALWLESHIQECASCREESRELATLLGAWRSLAPPRLSTGRLERVERAVLEANVAPAAAVAAATAVARGAQRTWKVPTIAAGIAATVAVVSLAMFWSKRQPPRRPVTPRSGVAKTVATTPQTAHVTHGAVHVFGPTGEPRVYGRGKSAPWNASLHTPDNANGVLALGAHATLGITAGAQIALRHQGSDTIIAVTRGTVALEAQSPGFGRAGRFRIWIPGRGEVSTRAGVLLVSRDASGVIVVKERGEAQYRWTEGGHPRETAIADRERLVHRLDLVRLDRSRLDRRGATLDAKSLVMGAPHRQPTPTVAQAPAAPPPGDCTSKHIQQSLARRDAMQALRTLEACRAAGQTSRALRSLEAQANLQAGRVRRAFQQYLAVAHSFRGSPMGQTALYSAGRIALRRLARKSQARHLFKHYLHTYPKGAHRANVEQLLRTL